MEKKKKLIVALASVGTAALTGATALFLKKKKGSSKAKKINNQDTNE